MISSFYEKIVGSSSQESNIPKILCVGLTCLDIVQTCKRFPKEDSDLSSVEHRWQRGGNASNTCTVLSLLGDSCEFFGWLSSKEHFNFLQNDMQKYKIDFSHCPLTEDYSCPVSTVILSLSSGSRTIIHHNPNLPETALEKFKELNLLEKFKKLNLLDYSWIHFEGRNTTETISMIQYVEAFNHSLIKETPNNSQFKNLPKDVPITISVELEKPKSSLLDLLPYADVAFISKDFAKSRGYNNMSETLKHMSLEAKSGATIICAWGDRGAMARTPHGIMVQSPAYPPLRIVDTLGAGDTFNAAVLHHLNKVKTIFIEREKIIQAIPENSDEILNLNIGSKHEIKYNHNIESLEYCKTKFITQATLQEAITFGCHIAGAKVGIRGYDGLNKVFGNKSEMVIS